ncbi:helix-turn-helix domain-containing protein [Oxalobacter formigenes]|nr:helix-turn-helix domain-containing protein [Oxalobacter formigenes]
MKIKQLVSMYGGQTALAGLLGIRQSAVAYWVKNNKIPGKWHQEMLSIAQKKGIDISAVDLLAVDLADKSSGTPLINEQSGQPGQYHVAPSASLHEGAEQFLFYASEDGNIKVQVFVRDETVWASQKGMAEIFDVDVRTINEHLQNIFKTRELDESAVIRNYRITADDGKKLQYKIL